MGREKSTGSGPELHSMELYCIFLDFDHFCPQPMRMAQCGRHMLTPTHREEKKLSTVFHFSSNLDLHWDESWREQRKDSAWTMALNNMAKLLLLSITFIN